MAKPRRDTLKLTTRQRISMAAVELFEQRGFDRVSVREIADATGVTPRTVFRLFPAKTSIVLDCVRFSYFIPFPAPHAGLTLYDAIDAALGTLAALIESEHVTIARHAQIIRNSATLTAMARRLGDEGLAALRVDLAGLIDEEAESTEAYVAAEIVYAIAFGARHEWLGVDGVPIRAAMNRSLRAAKRFVEAL